MPTLTHLQRVRMLYKTILRLHRGLPRDIQFLGNNYIRDEFRRHKKCTPVETDIFMNEWANYAITLAKQLGLQGPHTSKPLGKHLDKEDFDKLQNEQIYQLYELMMATTCKSKDNSEKK